MDFNETGGRRYLRILAVRKFTGSGFEKELSFLAVVDILYLFTAAASKRDRIGARWIGSVALPDDKVYVRTADGLFLTKFDNLEEILHRLDSFLRIHNSIALNETKIKGATLNTRTKQITVQAGQTREWLKVARRRLPDLEQNFGI